MGLFSRKVTRNAPHVVGVAPRLSDPALAEYLGIGRYSHAGISVTERDALGLTAVWRAVQLTSSTVASLPLKSYRKADDGTRVEVSSVFDDPGAGLLTPFEWKQLVMVHLLLHGAAPLLHVYNEGGSLAGMFPLHPTMVQVKRDENGVRTFKVSSGGETKEYGEEDMTYVMGMSLDGTTGCSPIAFERDALGTAIQGDRAAARHMASGFMIGGVITSDDDLDESQALDVATGLKAKLGGTMNAGDWAFVNASLKLNPWSMNAADAQFLEQRQYGVAEVARIFGLPVQMLAADGASSWGSGISELVLGWTKFTLTQWTTAIEERLSMVLSRPRFVEFETAGLLQGSPTEEIDLLIKQVDSGILTVNEARAIRNMPPLPEPVANAQSQEVRPMPGGQL